MAGEEGGTRALNLEGFEVVQAEVEHKQRQVRLTVLPQWVVSLQRADNSRRPGTHPVHCGIGGSRPPFRIHALR
jgi:hypothetical protein